MLDISSLQIPGGALLAGIAWVGLSALAGPEIAERSIAKTGWTEHCHAQIRADVEALAPREAPKPDVSCDDLVNAFLPGANQLCRQGGDLFVDLMMIDPAAGAKAQARAAKERRLSRIAELAPTRCSCAAKAVAADRTWWLNAGSLRIAGGSDDLQADLTRALHGTCALSVEG